MSTPSQEQTKSDNRLLELLDSTLSPTSAAKESNTSNETTFIGTIGAADISNVKSPMTIESNNFSFSTIDEGQPQDASSKDGNQKVGEENINVNTNTAVRSSCKKADSDTVPLGDSGDKVSAAQSSREKDGASTSRAKNDVSHYHLSNQLGSNQVGDVGVGLNSTSSSFLENTENLVYNQDGDKAELGSAASFPSGTNKANTSPLLDAPSPSSSENTEYTSSSPLAGSGKANTSNSINKKIEEDEFQWPSDEESIDSTDKTPFTAQSSRKKDEASVQLGSNRSGDSGAGLASSASSSPSAATWTGQLNGSSSPQNSELSSYRSGDSSGVELNSTSSLPSAAVETVPSNNKVLESHLSSNGSSSPQNSDDDLEDDEQEIAQEETNMVDGTICSTQDDTLADLDLSYLFLMLSGLKDLGSFSTIFALFAATHAANTTMKLPITLFVPTDDAFESFLDTFGYSSCSESRAKILKQLLTPKHFNFLLKILTSHTIEGCQLTGGDLTTGPLSTLNGGKEVDVVVSDDGVKRVNGATITHPDALIFDGLCVVHVIDQVIVPPLIRTYMLRFHTETDA